MEKIWEKSYPKGVPIDVIIEDITLVDKFNEVCAKYAKNRAITCNNHCITFKEVFVIVEKFASGLHALGVGKGDRVAVIMPNLMQYPICVFAVLKLGAIVVNVNPLYTESEMEYIIENSGAKFAIVLNMMASRLNNIVGKSILKEVIVARVPDLYPWLKRTIINFVIEKIKRVDVSYSYKANDFRKLATSKLKLEYNPNITNLDTAFLQYTGATTGKPKGAILSHRNIIANITEIHAWLEPQCESLSNHVVIDALPLYHIFSLTANLFTFFFAGSENVMVPNPRDVKDVVKVMLSCNFTVFNALDTLYNHLLTSDDFKAHKYPKFKYSVAGGMPAHASVANRWYEFTGVMPSNCYGMTEASPAVTMSYMDNTFDGSVGFPIPSTEVEIRKHDTNEVMPIGEDGIIWVRGPQVMSGYWHDEKKTAEVIDAQGWFNTGDIGHFNEIGKLFISSRVSDMIIVSGFNVYPVEVENVLDKISDIKEAAVIGVPDTEHGENVIAFVVLKPGCIMLESEIIYEARKELASYKVPRKIIFMEDKLPKTLVGKIDKIALAKQYLERSK